MPWPEMSICRYAALGHLLAEASHMARERCQGAAYQLTVQRVHLCHSLHEGPQLRARLLQALPEPGSEPVGHCAQAQASATGIGQELGSLLLEAPVPEDERLLLRGLLFDRCHIEADQAAPLREEALLEIFEEAAGEKDVVFEDFSERSVEHFGEPLYGAGGGSRT